MSNILLIEDNPLDAHMVKRAIEKQALAKQVQWIQDGDSALKLLQSADKAQWDLVLLDIMLPKVSGLEILSTLKRKKQLDKLPPIVVLSSSSIDKDIAAAQSLGAAAFYTKPDGYKELQALLNNIFKNWVFTPSDQS